VPETTIHRWPQRVVFALIGLAFMGAVAGRIAGSTQVEETGSVVASRDLRFADRADGAVVVTDAQTEQTVDVLQGEQGFIRSTMRGLARARRSDGIGAAPPFRLTAWSDGRLTLDDPADGRHLELQAFGSLNVAVFARLLHLQPQIQQAERRL
jgi:putative photosynthetic complex assembly protein